MQLLTEISAHTLGRGQEEILGKQYELRKSARGIIVNNEGKIALQHLQNRDYHKLPGGGIDPGEQETDALVREILEEVGYSITDIKKLGVVIEYRLFENLLHISYGFVATAKTKEHEPKLEPGEIAEGQITTWITPEEALNLMKQDTPNEEQGFYILEREKTFLKEYLKQKTA